MTERPEIDKLNVREKLVRIDLMLADIDRISADKDRKRQEIRYAPFLAMITGTTAGAALFAAGVGFAKVLG
jgi:hypothetical protein